MSSFFLGGEDGLGIDNPHGVVEHRCERAQTSAHDLGRRRLDGRVACRRARAGACHVGNLISVGKRLVDEGDGFGRMVDTDPELAWRAQPMK